MENQKQLKGITLNIEGNFKRLWFAVGTNPTDEAKFQECCNKIPEIGKQMTDLRTFVNAVVTEFEKQGFERVAR
jgi:hypothetical protein